MTLALLALGAGYLMFRALSREFAAARLQSDFVAAVSHEFRTPLTSLQQFTDMLREHQHLSEERRRLCYEAQARSAARLTRLVETLLDFGRTEGGARRGAHGGGRTDLSFCARGLRRAGAPHRGGVSCRGALPQL